MKRRIQHVNASTSSKILFSPFWHNRMEQGCYHQLPCLFFIFFSSQSLSQFPCSMNWLGVLLLPFGWDATHPKGTLQHFIRLPWQFASTHLYHLYSWVERGTVGVLYLVQEHYTLTWPCLTPWTLNLESSALIIRPLYLPATEL